MGIKIVLSRITFSVIFMSDIEIPLAYPLLAKIGAISEGVNVHTNLNKKMKLKKLIKYEVVNIFHWPQNFQNLVFESAKL